MNPKILWLIVIAFVVVAIFAATPSLRSENHPILNEIKRRFAKIHPKYATIPMKTGPKSYTEDKSIITLCIINPDTQQNYNINVIMYVACHELAHVISKASGKDSHEDEFKANFSSLLRDAARKGVYDPMYPIPTDYCGIDD